MPVANQLSPIWGSDDQAVIAGYNTLAVSD